MKRICNLSTFTFLIIYLMIVLVTSCKTEDPNKPKQLSVLSTTAITKITQNTATTGGNITSDNGLEVSARGVCWSLKPNPTINDSITKDAAGTGEFTSNISNLIDDTTYYVRAYATNRDGSAYGLQVIFKTLASVLPVLATTAATNVTVSTANCGGNITYNGGSAITERGVCWSTNPNPTVQNDKSSDGLGSGVFISNITNLLTGKTYYLRAYATNKAGTGYGNQIILQISKIPDFPVYLELNLTTTYPTFRNSYNKSLTFEKGVVATDRIGFGGILVYTGLDGEYYAFDMSCPYEAKQNIRVYPNDKAQVVCEGCGSVFDIGYGIGNPSSGKAKDELKRYKVTQSGYLLLITN